MSSSDLSEDPSPGLSRPAEHPPINQSSSDNFLLLHPSHPPEPLSLKPRRKVPFNLSFTPVSVPSSNRCRLLGFTPLAEHDTRPSGHPKGSFRGPPEVRAKECAPCALFFSRSDVFVSTEMEHQGLLAPSNHHYSSLKAKLRQPQPEQSLVEQACSEPDDGQASVTSSILPRLWDEPPASASSTRASSPLSCSDIYCRNPVGLLTPMPMPRIPPRKKAIRRTRSLMVKDEPEEWWADDELDEARRTESYAIEANRRMSEPSGEKPNVVYEEFESR